VDEQQTSSCAREAHTFVPTPSESHPGVLARITNPPPTWQHHLAVCTSCCWLKAAHRLQRQPPGCYRHACRATDTLPVAVLGSAAVPARSGCWLYHPHGCPHGCIRHRGDIRHHHLRHSYMGAHLAWHLCDCRCAYYITCRRRNMLVESRSVSSTRRFMPRLSE
jgi:hypothetical protein